jgi:hypothetical protein
MCWRERNRGVRGVPAVLVLSLKLCISLKDLIGAIIKQIVERLLVAIEAVHVMLRVFHGQICDPS